MINRNSLIYLESSKNLKIFSLLIFFSLFFIPFSSATAQFYAIPDVNLEYNTYYTLNLNNYCSSSQQGNSCRFTSYGVQFINPDNAQSIFLFPNENSINSYFDISLNNNGRVIILSKSKVIETDITIFGADEEFSSQASKSFTLNIQQVQSPEQIASFLAPILYGNQSISYNMNGFFLNYNQIRVQYNDDLLNQTISLQRAFSQSSVCSIGKIRVCLNPTSNNILLTVQGLNKTYSSSVVGGNMMYVTAINIYGEITDLGFPVNTFTTGAVPTFSALPIRTPISLAPALMTFNDDFTFNFSVLYSNYTSIRANFSTGGTIGSFVRNYTNGFPTSWTCTSTGSVCFESVPAFPDRSGVSFSNFTFTLFTNDLLLIQSKSVTQNYYQMNISACNNIGCINQDDFGNYDALYINVSGTPPEGIPLTFAPIQLRYGQIKSFNFNKMFSNFDYLILNWSESLQNFSVKTPTITNIYNLSNYVESGTPIYQTKLFYNNIFQVTSGNQDNNFTIYPIACNTISCIDGTLGIQQSITFIISDSSQGFTDVSVSSGFFRSYFNTMLGLFPEENSLESNQKVNILMITISVITIIILFFGYSQGGSVTPLIYFSLIINFFVFLFFTFKGYISPIYIITLILISIILVVLKYRSKS